MKIIFGLFMLILAGMVHAENFGQEWNYNKNISLSDLYKARASIEDIVGLSLPSGQQVVITYVTTAGSKGSELYRCVEFFDKSMRITRSRCYKLD